MASFPIVSKITIGVVLYLNGFVFAVKFENG